MKSQKGMGHVTVFIYMILILLIIGTTIYFAIFNLKEEKAQKHETEMLTIKGKVKILSEESTIKSDESLIKGRKLSENLEDEEIKKLIDKKIISEEEEDFDKYYILDNSNLEEIGLEEIQLNKGYYVVNYKTGEIIYTQGIKIDNELYYKLSDVKQKEEEKANTNSETETNETEKPQEVQEQPETQEETGE